MKRSCLAALLFAMPAAVAAQDDPTAMPDPAAQMQAAEQGAADQFEQAERSINEAFQQTGNAGQVETSATSSGHTHEVTRSHRDSFSLSSDRDASGGWGDRPSTMPTQAMAGRWTLAQDGGDSCSIELKTSEWFGGYSASTPAGCPKDFFDVNRWTMAGNQLQLTDTNNRVIGRFWQAGPDRWSGRRESDGARIYLNR